MRPLPSRSLSTAGSLPTRVPPRAALLEARATTDVPSPPLPLRNRVVRLRAVESVADVTDAPVGPQVQGRRGNMFTRLLRGVFRRPAPASSLKADATY